MKKYGLVGENLEYSYSKKIHDYLIDKYNVDASYDLIQISSLDEIDIDSYDGLNFTRPFKYDVIRRVFNRSDSVNTIKSANVMSGSKLYNTDINGVEELIKRLNINLDDINRIVILGNSKTSRTIKYLLRDKEVLICSRTQTPGVITYEQEDLLYGDLIINTTILGMSNYEFLSPVDESIMQNFKYAMDVNYNPMRNQFLIDAAHSGLENINGLRMLIIQAIRSFEIWHDIEVDKSVYDALYHYIVQEETNSTVFIGMPFSGKTFLKNSFNIEGLDAVETDEEIQKEMNMNIVEIIEKYGIDYFRELEQKVFKRLLNENHRYIFTGGGIVLNSDNIELLRYSDVILIDTPVDVLLERYNESPLSRPLVNSEDDLKKLYESRRKKYEIFANRKLKYEEIVNIKWS